MRIKSINSPIVMLRLVFLFFTLTPFLSLAQDRIIFSTDRDKDKNYEIIVTINNEEIYCKIDAVENSVIKYHISRSGADPKGLIPTYMVEKFYRYGKWTMSNGSSTEVNAERVKARNLILSEKLKDALEAYNLLISKDTSNLSLLMESSYVLALNGLYEGALYKLDKCWSTGKISKDLNFYTAQVFELMSFKDLANEFWNESDKNKAPEWISKKYVSLNKKYARNNKTRRTPSDEESANKFAMANILAAQNMHLQSIAMFRELTYFFPNEYIPYLGYSITLEKAGALNQSILAMEKAISLVGNSADDLESKKIYQDRLNQLKKDASRIPQNTLPGFYQPTLYNINQPQMMSYIGGMFGSGMFNFNARVGYFITNLSNGSLDFNYSKNDSYSMTTIGLSVYTRSKFAVGGVGLSVTSFDGEASLSYKISAGISTMNKKKTSSLDFFVDVINGVKKESVNTVMISIGHTLYFGRRK